MSKMELRSSRSRSKTPFLSPEVVEKDLTTIGNHVEKSIARTTRRTTVIKTSEGASSSTDEVNTVTNNKKLNAQKSGRSLRSRIFKTSDYSSEDGENEVTSSKILRQNDRNQLIENAQFVSNGSEMPALDLYKKSGRYWDVYPKTDWTYSRSSKDRVEIAPGVVAMPNMSRKTIHSLDDSNFESSSSSMFYAENVSHKNINTDDSLTAQYVRNLDQEVSTKTEDTFIIKRRTRSRWFSVFTSIITAFSAIFYYSYRIHTSLFAQIHRLASQVMLWDTYLLWKSRPGDKTRKLLTLCLVPLLLLGGIWLLSGLGTVLYGALFNSTSSLIPPLWDSVVKDRSERSHTDFNEEIIEKVVKVTEKIYVEPPSASEIASSFTQEQLEAIAIAIKSLGQDKISSEDDLVQKIINSPSFVNVINNHHASSSADDDLLNKQQTLIKRLLQEIETMREDILNNNKLRSEEYARLSLNMKKCCEKRPIVNVDGHITRLLNNPDFLSQQDGLKLWLHSLFVAKHDLEERLSKVSASMDSKLSSLVHSDSTIIMDKVSEKIPMAEVDTSIIKKIVKDALAIYDADRTGLVDYAMETMGGQVVTTRCTEAYHHGSGVISVLGVPLWHIPNSPRTVLTPLVGPGDCWAFQNFPGFLVIKLSSRVRIEAFSMEHISRLLMPEGKIDSAPKEFEVYGLKEENDHNPVLLGTYKFEYEGEALQFFPVSKDNQVFDMVEVRVMSNQGNPNYTCLYRFRVHGKLEKEGR